MSYTTPPKCLLIQPVLPEYRQPIIEQLLATDAFQLSVVVGAAAHDPTIRTADGLRDQCRIVSSTFLARGKLLWQHLPLREALAADVVVADLNPRTLSTWHLLILRRILRRPCVLWGHAWGRQRGNWFADLPRSLMRRLATVIITYTEADRRSLATRIPGYKVVAAPNAILPRVAMRPDQRCRQPENFIYVGRLVPAKKPALLVRAFCTAATYLPENTRLIVVGEGPEHQTLLAIAKEHDNKVDFLGSENDVDRLRTSYGTAIASVSPGYVGLSLTQSLGFGVPMLIADEEPHSPEIAAAIDGWNACFFRANDEHALADLMIKVAKDKAEWSVRRQQIARRTASEYSIETMVGRIRYGITLANSLARGVSSPSPENSAAEIRRQA